jgi:PKD repeat protein
MIQFDASNSSDDNEIVEYYWDFGDGTISADKKTSHFYREAGQYTVTLTVADAAMHTSSVSKIVSIVSGNAPVANAGNSYIGGVNGPPVYFDGNYSTDDYGILRYLWDVNDQIDADGDGNFINDADISGFRPFYTYSEPGLYTATLTVIDGTGLTDTSSAQILINDTMTPQVICVPWRDSDPTIPHETYDGKEITLKGIVRGSGVLTYQWNYGDGSEPYPLTPAIISDKYAIESRHAYQGDPGTRYNAKLTVCNEKNLCGSDDYYIIVKSDSQKTKTNVAVDEGLWYLHKTQNKTNGSWSLSMNLENSNRSFSASSTASSLQAFEINGHLQNGNNQKNPYIETVEKGFKHLFQQLITSPIDKESTLRNNTIVKPDSNTNTIGIKVNSFRSIYEGGMVMDAIASSNNPLLFVNSGSENIIDRTYYDIIVDMIDMYAWGQVKSGDYRGGWRYYWGSDSDNSACQWAAIGMMAAEDNFNIYVPNFVKTENYIWLSYSYDGKGFGYNGAGNGVATTPSGMVQLAFCEKMTSHPYWVAVEKNIADNWLWQNNNYYAMFALVKALRQAVPRPVVKLSSTGLDWFYDESKGINQQIIKDQKNDGSWLSGGYGDASLHTPWAIIMLTPTLFVQPPVANAGEDTIWGWNIEMTFDASETMHIDASRTIVKYEWDFDGDGLWDQETTTPVVKHTYNKEDFLKKRTNDDIKVITMRLRVTDDNDPPQTDIATRQISLKDPPFAPYAEISAPYTVTAGIPVQINGGHSYDIDINDHITSYEWDLDNDGIWFDNIDISTANPLITHTFMEVGIAHIGLKVKDSGAFNENVPLESLPVYASITVEPNSQPIADAGGPYTINVGKELKLDATNSYDANADNLTYAWDFDNDGQFDDAYDISPRHTWNQNGSFTIGLKVSDMLASDIAYVTVTVIQSEEDNLPGLKDTDSSRCFISTCNKNMIHQFIEKIQDNWK